jgi:predicted lipid-binding transport protein (Tim44 family)
MNPHAVDAALVLLAAEAVVLALRHRRTGRGPRLGDVGPTLLAGAGLLAALRVALGGGGAGAIGVCLLAALAAHLFDLRQRWRRSRTQQRPGD